MKKNNPIIRTCMVCRTAREKKDLVRFVKNKSGEILLDNNQSLDGRGCYVCKSEECLVKLKKTRALNRAFKINVSEDVYDRLSKQTKLDS